MSLSPVVVCMKKNAQKIMEKLLRRKSLKKDLLRNLRRKRKKRKKKVRRKRKRRKRKKVLINVTGRPRLTANPKMKIEQKC